MDIAPYEAIIEGVLVSLIVLFVIYGRLTNDKKTTHSQDKKKKNTTASNATKK